MTVSFPGVDAHSILSGLEDIGLPSAFPFVHLATGQSNDFGMDSLGSKVVQPGIFVVDNQSAPTSIVPVAFGTAPFNYTPAGGTSTDPVQCSNNMGVHFCNRVRLKTKIPATRPIILIRCSFGATSVGQSIGNGTVTITGTPTTGDIVSLTATPSPALAGFPVTVSYTVQAGDTTTTIAAALAAAIMANATLKDAVIFAVSSANVVTPMYPTNLGITWSSNVSGAASETLTLAFSAPLLWGYMLASIAVVEAAYPGFKINSSSRMQGENDNSGTFGSKVVFGLGNQVFWAQLRALPQWDQTNRLTLQELGSWDNNSQCLRNDFIRTTRNGYVDKFVTMVSSAGMVESLQNPGPHFDGNSLVTLADRHFAAWLTGRANGGYSGGSTYYGSDMAFPNVFSMPATGGQIMEDDIRSSAFIIANGGTITLPNPARFLSLPLYIYAVSGSTLMSSGTTLSAANRGNITSLSLSAGTLWRIDPNASLGFWRATQVTTNGVGKGDFSRYIQGSALTGTSTIAGSTQISGAAYTLNGATLTIAPAFGMDGVFIGGTSTSTITVSAGTFILPDGSTPTSITVLPGETIWLVGAISGTSSLSTYVIYDSLFKSYTVATLPASPPNGAKAYVSDASAPTFLGTLTGGGSTKCPVFADSSGVWRAG